MRILLVHNYYGSSAPSGENVAYEAERDLLRANGHQVEEWVRHSDNLRGLAGHVQAALSTVWNLRAEREIQRIVRQKNIELVHFHNTFPQFSPAVIRGAARAGAATVLTAHNYRLFCPAGVPLREKQPCIECLSCGSLLPALKHRCYRNSFGATALVSAMVWIHRRARTWSRHLHALTALTEYQKGLILQAGVPTEIVHVKPHFYANPPEPTPWHQREQKAVFIGRLGPEKGICDLIDAWARMGQEAPLLEVIGDGPSAEACRASVRRLRLSQVRIMGQLSFDETQRRLATARLLVVPSISFEGFPMVIREAFAHGVPVASSRLGSMACLVQDGYNGRHFAPGDSEDLARTVAEMWAGDDSLRWMATQARQTFQDSYTSEANYRQVMEIYKAAIARRDWMLTRSTCRISLAGIQCDLIAPPAARNMIAGWIRKRERRYVACANPHAILASQREEKMRSAMLGASLVIPDGIGIILAARLLGVRHSGRVPGPQLMLDICDAGRTHGYTHYFYGGAPGVPELLKERLTARFPGLQVAGVYSPPFRPLEPSEADEVVEEINAKKPDIVWVGLGCPKQEIWCATFSHRLSAVTVAVGAAFDFHSGRLLRAPGWMSRVGLEWLYRLMREPRRMWRRNLDSLRFLRLVSQQLSSHSTETRMPGLCDARARNEK